MQDFLKVYWPLILIGFIGLVVALRYVEPPPPKSVTFAAGGVDGAYYAYARRYAALMEEEGVTVEILETAGSLQNLSMLEAGDADIALVQGGIADPVTDTYALSLGGLFYEPMWVFVKSEIEADDFGALRDARMAIGPTGSGSRQLALDMQAEWGGAWPEAAKLETGGRSAADALLAGSLDAAVFSASVNASYVQELLTNPGIKLVPFARAPALSRRAPALAPTTLLRGVINIGEDLPGEDIELIAPVAQLTVNESLHPAIQALLLDTAAIVHEDGTLLSPAGAFPDGRLTDLDLSKEARRYYERGPSALRSYFSFSMANFLERAWILLIPLVTLLIPLVRIAPPVYRWRIRRKIYVWYSDLRELEARGRSAKTPADREVVRMQLEKLQEEAGKVDVPLSYTDDLYRLRNHIAFVRELIDGLEQPAAVTA